MNWQLACDTAIPSGDMSRRIYFFNEELPQGARNIHRVFPKVKKHGVVFESGEDNNKENISSFCGSIVRIEEKKLRLYYTVATDKEMRIAIAESKDGLKWTKKPIRQDIDQDKKQNYIVFTGVPEIEKNIKQKEITTPDGRKIKNTKKINTQSQVAGPQVVKLKNGKYRMYYWHHQHGWARLPYVYTMAESDDGIKWHVPNYDKPIFNSHWLGDQSKITKQKRIEEKMKRSNDATFVYYNPFFKCYEQYSQWFLDSIPKRRVEEDNCPDYNRMIQRRISADGLKWSAPELVIQADKNDPWDLQFYHMAVQYHEDWIIGSLGHYRVENNQQTMDIELAFSRDGRKWERPLRGGFIPRDKEARDRLGIHPSNAWIDKGDRWLCLYTAKARKHNEHDNENLPSNCIMAASWPKNRFVGLSAKETPGGFITPVFYLQGDKIYIDANIKGWLRAELCDSWGNKLEGFELGASIVLKGNSSIHELKWKNVDVNKYLYDPLRLRLEFADTDVYNVSF